MGLGLCSSTLGIVWRSADPTSWVESGGFDIEVGWGECRGVRWAAGWNQVGGEGVQRFGCPLWSL